MTFTPKVLSFVQDNGTTTFVHSKRFRGILVPLLKSQLKKTQRWES